MSDSILVSTKSALGLQANHTAFDAELIMHINSTFSTLTQLGLGPETGFMIEGPEEQWVSFLGHDKRILAVKSYIFLRVKMLFDPPDVGFVLTAMKDQIKELEWRLNVTVDDKVDPPAPNPDEDPLPNTVVFDGGGV